MYKKVNVLNDTKKMDFDSFFIAFFITMITLNKIISSLLLSSLLLVLWKIILGISIIFGVVVLLKNMYKNLKVDSVILVLILLLLFIYSFIMNIKYKDFYIENGLTLFIMTLPYYFLARCGVNYKNIKINLKMIAIVIIISVVILRFFFSNLIFDGNSSEGYSMTYAYICLFPCCLFLGEIFREYNLKDVFFLICSIFLLLSFGSRGAIVSFLIFSSVRIFLFLKTIKSARKTHLILAVIIFLTLAILVYLFQNSILEFLIYIMKMLNFSTRALESLYFGEIFQDSVRSRLIGYSTELIKEYPFGIGGIFADRIILSEKFLGIVNLTSAQGLYPHNIFLELLLQYGVFLGSIFIGVNLYILYNIFFKCKNKDLEDLGLLFFGIGFIQLFFSQSYTFHSFYFVFLGFGMNVVYQNKRR